MFVIGQCPLDVFCSDIYNMYQSQQSTFWFNACFAYWVQTKITCSPNKTLNDWLNIGWFCLFLAMIQRDSRDGNVSLSVHFFGLGWNISTAIEFIDMKCSTDTHGSSKMKPTDFGYPLTTPPAPPTGQSFHMSSVIFQDLQNGLAHYLV